MNATSIENGMTAAQIRLARKSPRNKNRIRVTSRAPSTRLRITVWMVLLMRFGAIVVWADLDARRQARRKLGDFSLHAFDHDA